MNNADAVVSIGKTLLIYAPGLGTVAYFLIRNLINRSNKRENALLENQFTKKDYLEYRREDETRHKKELEGLNALHEQQVKMLNQAHEDRVKNLLSIHEVENRTNIEQIRELQLQIYQQNDTIQDLQEQITLMKANG